MRRKLNQTMISGYRNLLIMKDIYKDNNTNNITLNKDIYPFNVDMKNILHTY